AFFTERRLTSPNRTRTSRKKTAGSRLSPRPSQSSLVFQKILRITPILYRSPTGNGREHGIWAERRRAFLQMLKVRFSLLNDQDRPRTGEIPKGLFDQVFARWQNLASCQRPKMYAMLYQTGSNISRGV